MKEWIRINPADTVAVALVPLSAGSRCCNVVLREDIPAGHKFALKDIAKGEQIIKYGNPIGYALKEIMAGSWVHVHNVHTGLGDVLSYDYQKKISRLKPVEPLTFQGYRRKDGSVGVRNEVWIIPTVGCVNDVCRAIEKQSQQYLEEFNVSHETIVDAVCAFPHPYGCSQMADDQENTRTVLADLIRHPNAGAVLVVGLGCENSNIPVMKPYIGTYDPERVHFLVAQECEDEIEAGVDEVRQLIEYAGGFAREEIPASELIIGMKCGGSDGLSGITANPAVGRLSDTLISMGATTILTEVPEMFGAEQGLMNRCETRELFEKTVKLINDFKQYYTDHHLTIYENPSPGNKAGGITTLEDKSLGCTQKSGSAPICGVLAYGERVTQKGLNLLSAPGNDLVSSTALAVSGAQIVLFTTGRGTPFTCPVPTVKISSNSKLAEFKDKWIDFNCGELTGEQTETKLDAELLQFVLDTASGRLTKAEEKGFHDMAIFKKGVTL